MKLDETWTAVFMDDHTLGAVCIDFQLQRPHGIFQDTSSALAQDFEGLLRAGQDLQCIKLVATQLR